MAIVGADRICRYFLLLLLCGCSILPIFGQAPSDEPAQPFSSIDSLGLSQTQVEQLRQSMDAHDYVGAERLLLAEIGTHPRTPEAGRQLAFVGSVYFLNHDYLNAAVAWKKSDAIKPLDPALLFSLAMDYVRIGRSDWARPVLTSLSAKDTGNALYPYWLGRLDYDGHKYNDAIRNFQRAIELAPRMARAYDNLGLCFYYQNQNELAIANYQKAIDLDRNSPHPSAWPYLNLAVTQQFLNRLSDAEFNLRRSIRIDPNIAQAHFQLGTVLEDEGRLQDAVVELQKAAALNATYPEPHMALARIYHKLGQEDEARREVEAYLRLHRGTSSIPSQQ